MVKGNRAAKKSEHESGWPGVEDAEQRTLLVIRGENSRPDKADDEPDETQQAASSERAPADARSGGCRWPCLFTKEPNKQEVQRYRNSKDEGEPDGI